MNIESEILKYSLLTNSFELIPQIPWDQKLVDCSLGNLYKEK
jgi:hypothetical protein